ncbi:MAG: PspC domain-containing protein [Arthrobacter sp.]
MNPHPEHPNEGNAPAGGAAEEPAAPAAETSAGTAANTSATAPLEDSAGSGAGNPPPPPYDYAPTPPPPPPYDYAPTPPPAGSPPQDFFDWIRSHGVHRGRERWVGGVASGIARHFGVDPLIVRGILIVLAIFAGVGVLLYGIAWALLPEPDGRIHLQEAAAGRWSSGMTGALITTVVGFPSLGSGAWGWDRYGAGPFLWTVFWVGGAIYLIYYLTHRNKSRNGATGLSAGHPDGDPAVHTAYPPKQATPAVPAGVAPFAATGYGASETPAHNGESTLPAPGWGTPQPPGATRPFRGGYQPVPGPVQPGKPRKLGPGTPAVAVTAGLALLVGGGIKILDVANLINLGTSSSAVIWASAAVVLGLGILIAGLRGRTSGSLGFLAALALVVGGIFNVLPNGDRFRPQNADWSPVSIEQALGGFDITAGTGTVDLTGLSLNPPLKTDLVVPLDATASNLTVVIPDTVPVEIQADMTMGNLNEGSQNHSGMTTRQIDYNTERPGATLIVKIDGTFSNVTIKEGN